MIGTVAFVVAFVVLGLAVVVIAMRSGTRKHRGTRASDRGAHRATTAATVGIALLFGAGIPAAIMASNSTDQTRDAPGGVELTEAQANGRHLFARNCSNCHQLAAANGVGKIGPSLDEMRPPKALTLNAIKFGRARGNGQMPGGLLDGQEAEDVADFVAAVAGR